MLYLASGSPRRKELLQLITANFSILSAEINEQPYVDESAKDFVCRMAKEKARAGILLLGDKATPNDWVLGSDTVVVNDGKILGKPKNFNYFIGMMSGLSGKEHQVMTSISVANIKKCYTELVTTNVTFRRISHQEMLNYWHSGEPQDKAGGYGIQAGAGKFVTHIQGSYFAVVGLPLFETEQLLIKTKIIL